MARILLGVSGGIAAYKSLELARLATKEGHAVRVLMTPTAQRVRRPRLLRGDRRRAGAHRRVRARPGPAAPSRATRFPEHDPIGHLEVVANADAYLIAPASANTIAKLAAGIADSMVTTSFLACSAPRLVAPAMNDRMYRDAATQANLATLRQRGITVIEPEEGALASRGEHGVGRLPEPRAPARCDRAGGPRADRSLGWPPRAGLGRRNPRADRSGPLHRQPVLRPHGPRPGRVRGAARGGGHPGRGQRLASGAPRRQAGRRRDGRGALRRAGSRVRLHGRAGDGCRSGGLPARPAPPGRRSTAREAAASSSTWSRPRTSSPGCRGGGATTRRSSASRRRPITIPAGSGRSWSARARMRSSSTTSPAPRSASRAPRTRS